MRPPSWLSTDLAFIAVVFPELISPLLLTLSLLFIFVDTSPWTTPLLWMAMLWPANVVLPLLVTPPSTIIWPSLVILEACVELTTPLTFTPRPVLVPFMVIELAYIPPIAETSKPTLLESPIFCVSNVLASIVFLPVRVSIVLAHTPAFTFVASVKICSELAFLALRPFPLIEIRPCSTR